MKNPDRADLEKKSADDGFIVVAVLWILGALAALVAIYSLYVSNTAIALAVNIDRVQAQALITAGVELAVYQLSSAPPSSDARQIGGTFQFRLGKASVAVAYRPENARIDLNAAPKTLLSDFFHGVGATVNDANYYADRIIGWRTAFAADKPDGEASLYSAAGLSYGPRGAPFNHVDELWLVVGLPPVLVDRVLPYVTVYSGQPSINFRAAAPAVIAALPGMTPERLERILGERQQAQPSSAPGEQRLSSPASKSSRVMVQVTLENARRINADVVILLAETGEVPYRVLSWRDDFDGRGLNRSTGTTF